MQDPPPTVGFHRAVRRVVRFGAFRADLSEGSLWRDGDEVKLPPRALAVLFYLLERPGRLVTKAALLEGVWKDAHVSETSLTEAIGILRQTLGDAAQHPQFIQTVHRRGYRFVAPLSVDPATTPDLAVVRPAGSEPAIAAERLIGWRTGGLAIAVLALAVMATLIWRAASRESRPVHVSRVTITLPPEQAPAPALNANPVAALSPDGRSLVYVAGSTGAYRLFVRTMDQFDARALPGTEGGHGPVFSPNGSQVAFFARGKLKRLRLNGGEPVELADAGGGLGAWWTPDDRIVFAKGAVDGLWEIDAGGGTPLLVAGPPDGASGYRWPQVLGDGDTVIATWWRSNARDASVVAVSRRSRTHRVLATPASYGRVIAGDTLVFIRDGALMAARFSSGQVTSPPQIAIDRVLIGLTGAGQFTTSDGGDLLYIPEDPERTFRVVVEAPFGGEPRPSALPARAYQNISLCDGRIAASVLERNVSDIWIGDLARGVLTRLTDQAANFEPVWLPGCRAIVFASSRDGVMNLYRMKADPGAPVERLQPSPSIQAPSSSSADGRQLLYTEISPRTRADIWRRLEGGRREPVIATGANESGARLSPDGRWIAFQVDDRGGSQVFLAPAREAVERVQVSKDGGSAPAWSLDGRRLFYRRGTDVVGADVSGSTVPVIEKTEVVLSHPDLVLFRVASGDSLLLVLRRREHLPLTKLFLVQNWTAEVRRLLDARAGSR